jgi:uncharacterized protein (TIGR03067 family)
MLLAIPALVGCSKQYKPEANPKGGGVHEPIEIDVPRPTTTSSAGRLEGKWRLTRIDFGPNMWVPISKPMFMVFSGNRVTLDAEEKIDTGNFTTRPGTREIDLTVPGFMGAGGDRTAPGIYEINGSDLKIAVQGARGGPRPTEFKATDPGKGSPLGTGETPHVIVLHLRRAGAGSDASELPAATVEVRPAPPAPFPEEDLKEAEPRYTPPPPRPIPKPIIKPPPPPEKPKVAPAP